MKVPQYKIGVFYRLIEHHQSLVRKRPEQVLVVILFSPTVNLLYPSTSVLEQRQVKRVPGDYNDPKVKA